MIYHGTISIRYPCIMIPFHDLISHPYFRYTQCQHAGCTHISCELCYLPVLDETGTMDHALMIPIVGYKLDLHGECVSPDFGTIL